MADEFKVHRLSEIGILRAEAIAAMYASLLDGISVLVPPGRIRAIVVTKLQEAAFWSKRGVAEQPENQVQPTAGFAPVASTSTGFSGPGPGDVK